MIFTLSALALFTTFAVASPTGTLPDTTPSKSQAAPTSPPEQLIAEAPIWGANDAQQGYAYLPVTADGHPATLLIDLTCTVCDLKLGSDALKAAGVAEPDAATWDKLTIGSAPQHHVPILLYTSLGNVPTPPNAAPIIGTAGVHFLTTRFDVLYDFPHRVVRLYALPSKTVRAATAWLPPGFTKNDCGKMVHIPPGAGTFTGVAMKIDGHPVTGVLEMGPYWPKINAAAFHRMGLTPDSARVVAATDPESDNSGNPLKHQVNDVHLAVGTHPFWTGFVQVFPELSVEQLLAPKTPVMLMNLSTIRDVAVFNSTSSNQVCFVKQ